MDKTHVIVKKHFDYIFDEEKDSVVKKLIKTDILNSYYSLEDAYHDISIENMYNTETEEYVVKEILKED